MFLSRQLMHDHRISAVALVDSENRLLGQLTPENLQDFLRSRRIDDLDMPISHLVTASSDQGQALSVTGNATVVDLLRVFGQTKSHRVFVVEDDLKLVGIISLKDFLAAILH